MKKKFIECDCGSHALVLQLSEDYPFEHTEPFVEIAFWQHGQVPGPTTFWQTLREKWHQAKIVWKRMTPYCDMVVLEKKEAKELRDYLDEYLDEVSQWEWRRRKQCPKCRGAGFITKEKEEK